MNDHSTKSMLRRHEGDTCEVYLDTNGYLTVGVGHQLAIGSKIPQEAVEAIFRADYAAAVEDYKSLGLSLDPARRGVIINMLFQMGLPRFKGFKRFMMRLREKDWAWAAYEMWDSKWRREENGNRALELIEIMGPERDEIYPIQIGL